MNSFELKTITIVCQGADKESPFCTGDPVFTLGDPEDFVIVCGEFDTGVQILSESSEFEQVFTVKKIINHPKYQPNRVIKTRQ